mgnify:CR=1 FL=1
MSDAVGVNLDELADKLVLEIRATLRESKAEGVSGLVSGAGVIGDVLKKVEKIDWGRDDADNYKKFKALFE